MLRSMTAFGRSSLDTVEGEILCEIRSVNHRYLDVGMRLPESIRTAEAGFREHLMKFVSRGKVDVSLKMPDRQEGSGSLKINEPLLAELTKVAGRVGKMTDTDCVVDAVRLLQWPGVVSPGEPSREAGLQDVQQVFQQAVSDFLATREREGLHLANLLGQRNQQIKDLVARLREHRPLVQARQRDRLLARIAELTVEADESRLEQELVLWAQRLDIDEELDRLDAHIVELGNVLQRKEPVGRRLDFLMQEFNRESNTIGSKSADSLTTTMTVDMKVLIEQMREQVQNIE